MRSPTVFLAIFSLLWSAGVLFFDAMIGKSLYDQWLSQGFVETSGTILTSRINTIRTDDTVSYQGVVAYSYDFKGGSHQSEEVGFSGVSASSMADAERQLKAYPPGTELLVYVNPVKPAQSFLFKGFTGESWVMGLFLTPFNIAMVFLWYGTLASRRPPRPIGGAEVRSDAGKIKIRWATLPPSLLGLAVCGAVYFLGTFVFLFLKGTESTSALPLGICFVGLGAGLFTWLKLRGRNALSHPDLLLDPQSGMISLNKLFITPGQRSKQNGPKNIRLEAVQTVRVVERVKTDSEGDTTRLQIVTFQYLGEDGTTAELDLNSWSSREEAQLFATWLRETLCLPDSSVSS